MGLESWDLFRNEYKIKEWLMLEVVYIIIALGLTVLVHELGHFLVAKALKIRVEAFSIGFGPEIISWKRGDTQYRIGWLVFLGGYVKLGGENPDEIDPNDEKAFLNQHPVKKMLVAVSGVIQNFIFAFVLLWIVFLAGTETLKPQVGAVKPGYPAHEAGIKKGDDIIQINKTKITYWNELTEVIAKEGKSEIEIWIKRNGRPDVMTFKVMPKKEETEDFFKDKKTRYLIGIEPLPFLPVIDGLEKGYPAYDAGLKPGDRIVSINEKKIFYWREVAEAIEKSKGEVNIEVLRGEPKVFAKAMEIQEHLKFKIKTAQREVYNNETKQKEKVTVIGIRPKSNSITERYGPVKAAVKGWAQVIELTNLTYKSIYKMILRKIQPDVAGPLGVLKISYEVAKTGIINLIFLFALINVNLALINFLPLLPLDGGLMLMFVLELITGKKVPLRVQESLMQFGWMLLIALLIFATYGDILRWIRGG